MPDVSSQRLVEAVAQMPAVVFQLRRAAGREHFRFVSERVGELLSLTPAELGVSSQPLWALLPAEDAARVAESLASSEAQLAPWDVEFQVRLPGEPTKWIALFAVPTRAADGAILWHGLMCDATVRHRAQQVEKMNAIARLAGGMAHDLNNLLTAIGSNSEMALSELPPDHAARAYLEQVDRAAARAADLTRGLLAFSRQQVLRLELLRWNDIVGRAQAAGHLVPTDRPTLALELCLDGAVATVRADRRQLEQVLANLVANAVDAMPAGGRLAITTGRRRITDDEARRQPGMRPGEYAWLSVQDTGAGFNEEVRSRLFEPFFTTKIVHGVSAGLGLSTVYGIVKQLGGYLEVESVPGIGSTFTVYLPEVVDAAAGAHAPDDSPLPPVALHGISRDGSRTVLIVEDEVSVREPVRRVLERFGYRVIDAPDGGTALALAEAGETIDLLLTDVLMPGMSGSELARRIRECQPAIRVVFMSGYSSEAIATHGMLAPGSVFLQKPFSVAELIDRVRETLANKAS